MSARDPNCPLCQTDGGELIWQGAHLRVIDAQDPDYPGFTRIIWTAHLPEMTSLSTRGRDLLMRAVYAVEQAQHDILQPDKINLAALGNMVPHLHWHIIPRWREDRHFPGAVWAAPRFATGQEPADFLARRAALASRRQRYHDRLIENMNALLWH
ncbi:HIT family protein [Bordetella avium]|uniref:Nucleotide-binding protein n=1 Tax=Bordetella avium (strain 197N) TaxID=360910 RepID=Q2L0V3_BORA1|nr:HIT family protein [Bordetella avium]AZY47850.1 HIT family protein [Bordetella avium]AZY51221.1 HIT family protein [Bordetella avium]RIQ14922.1 HIT family protein [Bordetella avium]RIQ18585.1 HIT family protein [Bordetella avium]RIQ35379.1 HIT family protein [Bordetella avium]